MRMQASGETFGVKEDRLYFSILGADICQPLYQSLQTQIIPSTLGLPLHESCSVGRSARCLFELIHEARAGELKDLSALGSELGWSGPPQTQ